MVIRSLLTVTILGLAGAASALPQFAYQRAELFAICSGRMSAMATHQSAWRVPNPTAHPEIVAEFDMLLDATLPSAYAEGVPERQPRLWKARGWSEIAGLLSETLYSFDAGRVERAAQSLESRLQDCRDVILLP